MVQAYSTQLTRINKFLEMSPLLFQTSSPNSCPLSTSRFNFYIWIIRKKMHTVEWLTSHPTLTLKSTTAVLKKTTTQQREFWQMKTLVHKIMQSLWLYQCQVLALVGKLESVHWEEIEPDKGLLRDHNQKPPCVVQRDTTISTVIMRLKGLLLPVARDQTMEPQNHLSSLMIMYFWKAHCWRIKSQNQWVIFTVCSEYWIIFIFTAILFS